MKQKSSVKDFFKSFIYAFNGIKYTLKNESNFLVEFIIAILVVIAGIITKISQTEWFFCILLIAGVLILELFNTLIENLCDLISTEYHKEIKVIKDISAGIVLVLAIFSATIGLIIFIPKIIILF